MAVVKSGGFRPRCCLSAGERIAVVGINRDGRRAAADDRRRVVYYRYIERAGAGVEVVVGDGISDGWGECVDRGGRSVIERRVGDGALAVVKSGGVRQRCRLSAG